MTKMSNKKCESILFKYFPDLIKTPLPPQILETKELGGVSLMSKSWQGDRIRRARICRLSVQKKFFAETLVIYPNSNLDVPIFGSEYIAIEGKKYFGVVDFHPLEISQTYTEKYIGKYLQDLPNRKIESSKFYDLERFFSKKMWMERSKTPMYAQFSKACDEYLGRFSTAIREAKELSRSYLPLQVNYDQHMGHHDPAHGILKAYFSNEFADYYIENFLFNLIKESNERVEKSNNLCKL